MIDWFVLLTPILLLGVIALLGFLGCDQVFGLDPTTLGATINSVKPPFGSPAGGIKVTIDGSGFGTSATVTFGGTATPQSLDDSTSDTEVVRDAPQHSPGVVDVVVTSSDGATGTASGAFTYSVTHKGADAPGSGNGVTVLQLAPVQGQLIVVTALWNGAGTLSFTTNPPTTFTLVNQSNLAAPQNIHVAVYFANNIPGPVAIKGSVTGGIPSTFSLLASGYDFVDPTLALTPDQFNSAEGSGASLTVPLQITDLSPGDLIYAVGVSRDGSGALAGGLTAPINPDGTVTTRSAVPIPAYFLVYDQVLIPDEIGTPPLNVSATGTLTASWYMFAMRVKVGS